MEIVNGRKAIKNRSFNWTAPLASTLQSPLSTSVELLGRCLCWIFCLSLCLVLSQFFSIQSIQLVYHNPPIRH